MSIESNQLAIYQNKHGAIELAVDASAETIWATQKQLAEVFEVDVRTINDHIENIYGAKELQAKSTIRKIRIVQTEGSRQVLKIV